jgi:hypothetical protein
MRPKKGSKRIISLGIKDWAFQAVVLLSCNDIALRQKGNYSSVSICSNLGFPDVLILPKFYELRISFLK